MSVENFADPQNGALAVDDATPEHCFYCGAPLLEIAVLWRGRERAIALHAPCAQRLALHLAKDGLIADHIGRGNGHLIGIDKTLISESSGTRRAR